MPHLSAVPFPARRVTIHRLAPATVPTRRIGALGAISSESPLGGRHRLSERQQPGGPARGACEDLEETGSATPSALNRYCRNVADPAMRSALRVQSIDGREQKSAGRLVAPVVKAGVLFIDDLVLGSRAPDELALPRSRQTSA